MTKGEYMESQGMRSTINPKVLREELDDSFKKFVDSLKAGFDSRVWDDDDSGDID